MYSINQMTWQISWLYTLDKSLLVPTGVLFLFFCFQCTSFALLQQPQCLIGYTPLIFIENSRDKIRDKTTLNSDKFKGRLYSKYDGVPYKPYCVYSLTDTSDAASASQSQFPGQETDEMQDKRVLGTICISRHRAKIADDHRHMCLREENCCIKGLLLGQHTPTATAASHSQRAKGLSCIHGHAVAATKVPVPSVRGRKKRKPDSMKVALHYTTLQWKSCYQIGCIIYRKITFPR